jgi:POT family proton-dependent oligopeptide transporter
MNENGSSGDTAKDKTEPIGIPNPITELVESFRALKGANKGFWYSNIAYWLDGISYFGMLTLLAMFFHDIAGLSDDTGHRIVSIYAGIISGSMLVFGPVSDRLTVRKSLIISVILFLIGRIALPLAPALFPVGSIPLIVFCIIALIIAGSGNGFMQPAVYAGVRKFSDKKTAAMGYGLLYAGMNLGIVFIGLISSRIRTGLHLGPINFEGFGITGVFWFCIFVNFLMLIWLTFAFTKKVERESTLEEDPSLESEGDSVKAHVPAGRRFSENPLGAVADWFKLSPVSNGRFMFFIFVLLPVQTLFAYQWLVMPQYITRAYSELVANNMESIVNVMNPLIIVLGVPVITAMTRRAPVYKMMIIGSLVSAVPAFLFCFGPKFHLLMIYYVLFSLGEALWQPRFLQYAAELAPKGRTGAYVAYANMPWFMVKFMAGFYTGRMMDRYCPAGGPFDTEMMWLIYGVIAMISPLGLILGRRWVEKGMRKP